MLAKALARSLDVQFSRLQFTPDLLPSDVTGVNVFNQATNEFEFRPGPGVRERPARRRDQPRLAEDAGRAARVHAGEPGHGRRRLLRARAAVHGARDAEPDRVRGHVPAARGAARPLHAPHRDRLPAARRRGADARPSRRAQPPLDTLEPVASLDELLQRDRGGEGDLRRGEPEPLRRRACCGTRAPTSACTSAPARAPGSRCCGSRSRARWPTAAATSSPDDVKAVAEPVLAHRLILAPEARASGLDRLRPRPRGDRADPRPGVTEPTGAAALGRARRRSPTSAPGRSARSRSTRSRSGCCSPSASPGPGSGSRTGRCACTAALPGRRPRRGRRREVRLELERDGGVPPRGRS